MADREHRRGRDKNDRPRNRSRSRSPRRREKSGKDDGLREQEQLDKQRLHSPPRKRRHHSRSRSRSRERSPRREKERGRERRSRSRSNSRSRHKKRRSRSSSSSSSDSSRSDRHRKRRKDKHHRKRSESRDRTDKVRKKEKKDKKKKKKGTVTAQWGKYGIINESNMYDKEAEFRTWLVEERKINPEVITKDQTKKEFARFTEDFNTATLPHEKYYNMYNYEQRMSSMRNGEVLTIADDGYDPNADLLAHTSAHKKPSTSKETYMSTEQLQELRRVQAERSQVGKMKLMGMDVGQTFGVRMDGSVFDG